MREKTAKEVTEELECVRAGADLGTEHAASQLAAIEDCFGVAAAEFDDDAAAADNRAASARSG